MRRWAASVWRRANFTDRMYLVYFVGLGVLIFLLRHRVPGWPAFVALHVIGTGLLVAVVLAGRLCPTAHAWYPLAMPILTFEEVAQLNFLVVDGWRDVYLLRAEAWLFSEPPTVWLSRFATPVVTEVLELGYFSYFFLLIIVGGVLYRRADKAPFFGVMAASVLSYLLCYAVFITFPTEGPAHTLRHLHTVPLTGGPFHWAVTFVQQAGVHGNAFPSAHVAGAVAVIFLAWCHAPGLALWLTPLVGLLSIGAVYDRYHYVSDVVAGILVGVSAAFFVSFSQRRPRLARWLNLAAVCT
jgi:membrane-associated phospholipid phosphatase